MFMRSKYNFVRITCEDIIYMISSQVLLTAAAFLEIGTVMAD